MLPRLRECGPEWVGSAENGIHAVREFLKQRQVLFLPLPKLLEIRHIGSGEIEAGGPGSLPRAVAAAVRPITGVINIALPEATAIELVGYAEHCGYLDNVATVLSELAESLRGDLFAAEARRAPVAWVQRLGFVLSFVEAGELAKHLESVLSERKSFTVALAPWKEMSGARRDPRWNVAVNVELAPDL